MNTEQEFEEFARKWPDLFQKSKLAYVGVGKGWHNILDTLFGLISYDVNIARSRLDYAVKNPGKLTETIEELEDKLNLEKEKLPVIDEIKEKYGGLRVYVDNSTEEINNFITFAEAIASKTCEVCGNPGHRRTSGWIKTLCDDHHQKREEGGDIWE